MGRNRFLGGLLETKKANPKDAPLRSAGSALANGSQPLGVAGPWDMQAGVTKGLERVAHVYRCCDAIAQTQARLPINQRKVDYRTGGDRATGKIVDDQDIWNLLNFRANSYETAWAFRYRLSMVLLLSRRGAFIEMVPGTNGKVAELHLMSPGMVEPIPDPVKFVSGYSIQRADYKVEIVEPERVLWIKVKPHPMDPYSQLTPLMAAGVSVDTDFLARQFNRNFMMNDGRPGMLVTIQGQVNPQDAEEIKSRFNGGYAQAGKTSVIEADGLDVADLAASPRDMQWAEMLAMTKEDIMLAFGVPESVMGNASGRTFDNADAERENFYIDTMQTHCEPIAHGLDPLTGDTTDDNVIAYDFSGVDVLQRAASRRREEFRTEFSAGLITIDEYREASNREAFNVVGSRVLFTSAGLAIAKNPEDQAGIMEYRQIGADPGAGLQGADAAESGALSGVRRGLEEGNRQRANTQQATAIRQRALSLVKAAAGLPELETKKEKKRKPKVAGHVVRGNEGTVNTLRIDAHPYLAMRHKMEGMIEGALGIWDQRQESVVAERLTHGKFRKGTRHWEGIERKDGIELKALDPQYPVQNPDQWANEIADGMSKFLRDAMLREAKNAIQNMQADGARGVPEPAELPDLLDGVYARTLDIVRDSAKNQTIRITKAIEQMDADGATIKQMERKVRQMTGTRTPWRKSLAINVTTTAVEAARSAVYELAGSDYVKTWHTEEDERVRATHRAADGQERKASELFRVGSVKMMHPCAPNAPISEVANCRCWAEYEFVGEA